MAKKTLYIVTLCVVLVACSQIPKEAYFSRGAPEGLLDTSSEVVNLQITSPVSVQEITNWVNKDQPTRADLACQNGNTLCAEVQEVLHQFGVPVKYTPTPANNVALIYERVLARDCENRYIDNPVNPYNLNHPTFGCSTTVNVVQMVGDKHQFTNPALMDYTDAAKATQLVDSYREIKKPDTEFSSINQSGGGGSGGSGGSSR